MYHEEQIINGKLCWRGLPNSEWVEYTQEQLTKKLITEAQFSRTREQRSITQGRE